MYFKNVSASSACKNVVGMYIVPFGQLNYGLTNLLYFIILKDYRVCVLFYEDKMLQKNPKKNISFYCVVCEFLVLRFFYNLQFFAINYMEQTILESCEAFFFCLSCLYFHGFLYYNFWRVLVCYNHIDVYVCLLMMIDVSILSMKYY